MRKFFGVIGGILWFPFALMTNLPVMVAINLLVGYLNPGSFGFSVMVSIVLAGAAMPIELKLRPERGRPKLRSPQVKALVASFAKIVRRGKGGSPSVSAAARRLPAPLRKLVHGSRNQVPASIAFERAKAEGKS